MSNFHLYRAFFLLFVRYSILSAIQVGSNLHVWKTIELTKFQVGDGTRPANIIVSTIKEAENVVPLLVEMKQANREVNVSIIQAIQES